ncbi:unnamed protein product, partial [marine sediment metagenome]
LQNSPFPPITNRDPETVPAVPERIYDTMYMTNLDCRRPKGQLHKMFLNFSAYCSAEDRIQYKTDVEIRIEDVFVKAAEMPAFAEALAAVMLVGNLLCEEQQLVISLEELDLESPEALAILVELDTLRATMATATLADLSA